jgi:Tol biopolymer transport system component
MKLHLVDLRDAGLVLGGVLGIAACVCSPAFAAEFQKTASKSVVKSVSVTEGTNMSATVSPDHKTILLDLQESLWSLPMAGGKAKRLTDPMLEPSRPDWSPRGDLIAFQGFKGGTFHIWLMKPDGSGVRQLTDGHGDDREPRISPDGTKVVFASDRAMKGNYDIWVADIVSGKLSQKTFGSEEEYEPTWSPDGSTIGFISGVGVARGHGVSVAGLDLKTVDAAGTIKTIHSLSNAGGGASGDPLAQGGHLDSPAWSPDGKTLAYTVTSGGKSELTVDGKKVGTANDVFPFYPTWLPGNKILYTGDGKIIVTDLASNESKEIPFSATFDINRPGYKHRIYDFDAITPKQVKGILHPSLSPDGKQIVFTALNQLWLMTIGDKPHALTDDNFYKQQPSFSPDGKSIVYSSDKGGWECMYIMDLATKASRRVTSAVGSAEIAPSWSGDGKQIAFHDQDGATLVADVATGSTKEVMKEVFGPSQPSWLANGNVLTLTALTSYNMRFREGTSRIVTLDLTTGKTVTTEPAPFATILTRAYNGPTYSPDGKQLVFAMDDYLWTMAVDANGVPSGAAKQITHEISDSPSWSGDSKQILYLSNAKLKLISADGSPTVTSIPLDLSWHRDLPAGRLIIHAGKLWDGLGADVKQNVDITIVKDRIESIKPHTSDPQNLPAGDRFVDASSKTVIPGLWESHNHNYGGIEEAGDASGRLWLAYGFTTLQSQGDEGYSQIEVKESFGANTRVGPRYFAAAELFDGERIFYPTDRSIRSEGQIQREFDRAQALDVDNYKTYVRLPHAWQKEIMNLAHNKAGVWIASHYGLPGLLYGMDGMSHVSATSRWGYAYTRSLTGVTYNDVRTLFPAAGMWDISTAFASSALYAQDPKIVDDPRLKTLDAPWAQKAMEQTLKRTVRTNPTGASEGLKLEDETIASLYKSGDEVMLGIDSAAPGAQIPIHLSLRAEVMYGLKPWEALQTATLLPARAFGYGKDLGSLEVGKLADLDIIDGNPLEDIKDTVKVNSVVVNGRYYTTADLMAPFVTKP